MWSLETDLKYVAGVSLCFLYILFPAILFFLFFIYFFPPSAPGQNRGRHGEVPSKLREEVHREEVHWPYYGSESPVSLSHLIAVVFVPFNSPGQLSMFRLSGCALGKLCTPVCLGNRNIGTLF